MKIYKQIAILLATALMLCTSVWAFAEENAEENINLNRNISLTLSYKDNGTPITNAEFSIYMVSASDEYGNLSTASDFADYNVNITNNGDELKTLAYTLEGYVLRDGIAPVDKKVTDKQGLLTFSGEEVRLKPGLYLVLGARHTQNEIVYEPQPFVVSLPAKNQQTGGYNYDVTVSPKNKSYKPDDNKVTCKVLKVWNDSNSTSERPKNIVVQLLQNGKVYDAVTLSAENNWRYKWENLAPEYQWTVVEKDPGNYTVSVEKQGVTYVITNTLDKTNNNNPNMPLSPPNALLPQTGQLWWPVPLLSAAGLLLIIIGLARRRGRRNEK